MTVNLGDKARDPITKFEGLVTGRYDYLYGCVRVTLERIDKDGKPEEVIFDELRLEVVEHGAVARPLLPATAALSTGGPRDAPPARAAG